MRITPRWQKQLAYLCLGPCILPIDEFQGKFFQLVGSSSTGVLGAGTKFVILRHQTFDEAQVTSESAYGANKESLSAFVED
ncbi:hypothetical protein Y1Q_0021253 [Alligator mississippiensis]|uniref:Uncharacterized protein n=1 Tax=Alligator mississippiensis TaxID=8496 RepID=A0A151MS73_ALLMI|nr:hypothetical protein Y1Q_0021253 [Alligator mississippiensis]